jgi:hypothetical protein
MGCKYSTLLIPDLKFIVYRILLAKLHLDFICGLRSDRSIKEALVTIPSTMYHTYDEILEQLMFKNPESIEDIKSILQWLAYSMVPLTLEQLAEAISIRPEDSSLDEAGIVTDAMDLVALCGTLVTAKPQNTSGGTYEDLRGPQITLITLSHASVEEYLKSGKMNSELKKTFDMDAEHVNLSLAKTCLQYIGFDDFKEPIEPWVCISSGKSCI